MDSKEEWSPFGEEIDLWVSNNSPWKWALLGVILIMMAVIYPFYLVYYRIRWRSNEHI